MIRLVTVAEVTNFMNCFLYDRILRRQNLNFSVELLDVLSKDMKIWVDFVLIVVMDNGIS